jgi:hypothetical protein
LNLPSLRLEQNMNEVEQTFQLIVVVVTVVVVTVIISVRSLIFVKNKIRLL